MSNRKQNNRKNETQCYCQHKEHKIIYTHLWIKGESLRKSEGTWIIFVIFSKFLTLNEVKHVSNLLLGIELKLLPIYMFYFKKLSLFSRQYLIYNNIRILLIDLP